MKIWKKIFLYSLILFIIVFNGAGFIIIENIYNRNTNIAVKSSLSDEKDIINSIYLNSDLLQMYFQDSLWSILKNYIYNGSNEIKNIEILDERNNKILKTSNLNIKGQRPEIENASMDEIKFIIRNINNKKYISASSIIKVKNYSYKIIITKDISYLDQDKMDNYKLFLILSLVVTIVLSIGLYIISKKITNPIESLTKASNIIKKGQYDKRVNYDKKDEIGILSQNFNSMMKVIEDKISELENMNNQKQRFINNLTHEMKTPITSIIGYSDLLIKGNVNDNIKLKSLMHINSQGHRLENLSSSLIKLIMVRNKEVEKNVIQINQLVSESIIGLNYKLYEKNITVIKDIKDKYIVGDTQLIGVLLNNILENSIKASYNNSSIEVNGKSLEDNKYELNIKDNGVGISEDDLDKIKEPFYMGDKSRNNRSENMGLGLAICTEICNLNEIEFEINSKLNYGTTVTLIFKMECV